MPLAVSTLAGLGLLLYVPAVPTHLGSALYAAPLHLASVGPALNPMPDLADLGSVLQLLCALYPVQRAERSVGLIWLVDQLIEPVIHLAKKMINRKHLLYRIFLQKIELV